VTVTLVFVAGVVTGAAGVASVAVAYLGGQLGELVKVRRQRADLRRMMKR
jgi:hypothetical protein